MANKKGCDGPSDYQKLQRALAWAKGQSNNCQPIANYRLVNSLKALQSDTLSTRALALVNQMARKDKQIAQLRAKQLTYCEELFEVLSEDVILTNTSKEHKLL